MSWSVSRAARETGLSKSTISRAIKSGRISAVRQHDGSYHIEPAELFRTYPRNPVQPASDALHDAPRNSPHEVKATPTYEVELLRMKLEMTEQLLAQEREHLRVQHDTIQDLRKRLDIATDRVLLLTQHTQPSSDAPRNAGTSNIPRQNWWPWRRTKS